MTSGSIRFRFLAWARRKANASSNEPHTVYGMTSGLMSRIVLRTKRKPVERVTMAVARQ